MATTEPAALLLESCLSWQEQLTNIMFGVPWIVSIVMWVLGQMYGVLLLTLYGFFLFGMHYLALAFNGAANEVFNDPFCTLNTYLGGVSHTAFYLASIATFYVSHYIESAQWPRKLTTTWVTLVFFVPPLTMVWFGVRSPASVGLSLVAGIVSTGLFFAIVTTFIDEPQYLARVAIFEYFHFNNGDFLMSPDQVADMKFEQAVDEKIAREARDLDKLVATGVLRRKRYAPSTAIETETGWRQQQREHDMQPADWLWPGASGN